MRMMKLLTIFLIGLVTLTAVNTALAVDLDDDTLTYTHVNAHLEPTIELPHYEKGTLTIPIHNNVRAWNYEDIEIV